MNVLVTGASGFLGQYVVVNALRKGHHVRAVVRPNRDREALPWANHRAVDIIEADLSVTAELDAVVAGVDAVIHLAASKSSDFSESYQGTVITTKHLLRAMEKAQVWRLIAISSFSVYGYLNLTDGTILDETCPLEANPGQRDAYTQTKLMQEHEVCEFASHSQSVVTTLRPGMIYGRGALWNACHGVGAGSLWLLVGSTEQMPLTYVENCAEAIVTALATESAYGKTINIVDDDLPSRQAYTNALIEYSNRAPKVVLVSWPALRATAQAAWFINQRILLGKLKMPGLLIPARLDARLKPLTYSNTQAKKLLHWYPHYSLQESLNRCCNKEISLFNI